MVSTLSVWLHLNYITDKLIIARCRAGFNQALRVHSPEYAPIGHSGLFLCTRPDIVCVSRVTAHPPMNSSLYSFFLRLALNLRFVLGFVGAEAGQFGCG